MLRAGIALLFLAMVLPGAALAQPQQPAPPELHADSQQAQCGTSSEHQTIVCGNRERSPYRIDETTLDVDRAKEQASNPPRVQDRSGNPSFCGTVDNECGGGTIPLLGPALRVASAIVDAIKGDDWRQAFKNGPSDYERYQDAKKKRGRISVGISADNGGRR